MLQLQAKSIDICRISKLLVKYNVKASISNSVITLSGDVSDELLTKLCGSIDINAVQNFISEEPLYVMNETTSEKSEERIQTEVVEEPKEVEATLLEETQKVNITRPYTTLSNNTSVYNLIYPEVKRGEVYLCDFGEPYGSEQGLTRYAIVIQNDEGNLHSPTTIVIPCTTENKKSLPVHLICTFSSKNMIGYNSAIVGSEENVILAEQIRTVDKTRLRKYYGRLTPDFMKMIEEKIDVSLQLSREVKTIVKQEKVYIDRPRVTEKAEAPKERKDVNMIQVQLLSYVDTNELLKISQSNSTDELKAHKILEAFGFDFEKNGVQYLLKAIIDSPKNTYFNLETLSESVSQEEGIEKEEVKRLIVARVKERFNFRKAPTIDFIRLVNSCLVKQEV